jgi:hypothetical protein
MCSFTSNSLIRKMYPRCNPAKHAELRRLSQGSPSGPKFSNTLRQEMPQLDPKSADKLLQKNNTFVQTETSKHVSLHIFF